MTILAHLLPFFSLLPGSTGARARERLAAIRDAKAIARARRRADKGLQRESKLYAKIITHAWQRMGNYNWSGGINADSHSKIKRVKFDYCYPTDEIIYFHIQTNKLGLLQNKDEVPHGVRVINLLTEDVLRELSIACRRPVTEDTSYTRSGAWIKVHRTERIDGLPEVLRFSEIEDRYPADMSKAPIIVGTAEHRILISVDFEHTPHWLVAGTTGSGKSNFVNNLLCGLIRYTDRKDTLIILIDLKGLEFPFYVNAPQLLMPVIMDIELVVDQLKRLKKIIKYRARLMGGKAKNLAEWNKLYPDKHMPRLFMLIDEFAELTTAADDQQMAANIKRLVGSITALGRAVGIHVVVATQHPSTEVIPSIIKVNMPAIFSGAVPSDVQSRVVLGTGAAAKLADIAGRVILLHGATMQQIQTPLITDDEIRESVNMAIGRAVGLAKLDGNRTIIDSEGLTQWLLDNGGIIPTKEALHRLLLPYGIPESAALAYWEQVAVNQKMVPSTWGVCQVVPAGDHWCLVPVWQNKPESVPEHIFGIPDEVDLTDGALGQDEQEVVQPEPKPVDTRDQLQRFIDDRCTVKYGLTVRTSTLFKSYLAWCGLNEEVAFSQVKIASIMKEKGFVRVASPGRKDWHGIALVSELSEVSGVSEIPLDDQQNSPESALEMELAR